MSICQYDVLSSLPSILLRSDEHLHLSFTMFVYHPHSSATMTTPKLQITERRDAINTREIEKFPIKHSVEINTTTLPQDYPSKQAHKKL